MAATTIESCGSDNARLRPVIDRARCEGKADCVRVCPFGVFEVRAVAREEKSSLRTLSRLKLFMHGGKQAFTTAASACHACGLCVSACPENAIVLKAA